MVVVKRKVGKQEIVSINSFSSLYALFDDYSSISLKLKEGWGKIKFYINDDFYPNPVVERFENYGDKALVKYHIKKIKNYSLMQVFENKERGIRINNVLRNLSSTKRKYKFSVHIEISSSEGRIDELRDAYVFDSGGKQYIVGVKGDVKNILVVEKTINNGKAKEVNIQGEVIVDRQEEVNIPIILADSIDDYDTLLLSTPLTTYILKEPSALKLEDKSIEKLYAFSTKVLSNAYMYNPLWDTLRLISINNYEEAKKKWNESWEYIKNKKINNLDSEIIALLKIIDNELRKRYKDYGKGKVLMNRIRRVKNVGALALIDENMLGNSIYHTIALSYDLLNKKHYEEAYKLLVYFSNTMYDMLLLSKDLVTHEVMLKELVLFNIVVNSLFFHVEGRKGKKIRTYIPSKYVKIENRKVYLGEGWGSISVSKASNGFMLNCDLTLQLPINYIDYYVVYGGKEYYRRIHVKGKGERHIKDVALLPRK